MPIGARTQNDGAFNKVSLSSDSSSSPEPVQPCTSRKMTPEEALALKVKLPWEGKVEKMHPNDLTKPLFLLLEEYGLRRAEIQHLFRFGGSNYYEVLRGWQIPPSTRTAANKIENDAKKDCPKKRSLSQCAAGKPPPFLAADEMPIPFMPVEAEPVPMPQPTLIDVAGSLIDAVNRRDAAICDIEFYIQEIQRMARGGTQ